jgi:predicted RNase H-like HicB family nuclease
MAQSYILDWRDSTRAEPRFFDLRPENGLSIARQSYRVSLEKGQDGWIVAKCLDIVGAISQGKTREEALRNIVEAISAILEDTLGRQPPEFLVTWEEK